MSKRKAEEDPYLTETDSEFAEEEVYSTEVDTEPEIVTVEEKLQEISATIRKSVIEAVEQDPEMKNFGEEEYLVEIKVRMNLEDEDKKELCGILAGIDYIDFPNCYDNDATFVFEQMFAEDTLEIVFDPYMEARGRGVGPHASDEIPIVKGLRDYLRTKAEECMSFERSRDAAAKAEIDMQSVRATSMTIAGVVAASALEPELRMLSFIDQVVGNVGKDRGHLGPT